MKNTIKNTIKTRKIGFILANDADGKAVNDLKTKLEGEGGRVELIAPSVAPVKLNDGSELSPKHSLTSTASVCFDALVICPGENSVKN